MIRFAVIVVIKLFWGLGYVLLWEFSNYVSHSSYLRVLCFASSYVFFHFSLNSNGN